jgi:hypothetical protein
MKSRHHRRAYFGGRRRIYELRNVMGVGVFGLGQNREFETDAWS